ncbi:MAG TPA: transcription elongation factor GreA [Patescibacteria group bacterium]|nr:transcription elongation factor GreA [Patescibacteria group bacterium]
MTDIHILTLEGKKKLEEELDFLKNVKRKEIVERIELSKEHGDLSENAEYQEARNEQSFMEGRILEIENILKNSMVASGDNSHTVQVGSKVTVELNGQSLEFTIVGSSESDPLLGLISCDSPIGKALLDKKSGDEVRAETPRGLTVYKIKKIN